MTCISKKIIASVVVCGLVAPQLVAARTANDPFASQWGYERADVERAWDISTGSRDVVVAVIDNGFDTFHPELRNNLWVNQDEIPDNLIDDDNNGYVDDVYGWDFVSKDRDGDGEISEAEDVGDNDPRPEPDEIDLGDNERQIHHGTVVAGIIGAEGNNGTDGAGINWNVRLMNLRFVENNGVGSFRRLAEVIRYAVDNGADVINLSLVGPEWTQELQETLEYAKEQNVVVVAAAGNKRRDLNEDPRYPVCADQELDEQLVLGVSAIQEDRRLAVFSNVGSSCVDVTAPGVNIASIQRFSPTNGYPDRYGDGWNGTSFAAPFVSGVAALVRAVQPSWTADQIYDVMLRNTSVTDGQDDSVYAELFGAGLIQAGKTVIAALDADARDRLVEPETDPVAVGEGNTLRLVSSGGTLVSYSDGKWAVQEGFFPDNGWVSATAYERDGQVDYALASVDSATGETTVSFYNQDGQFIRSWVVPTTGSADIRLVNLIGSDEPEVAIAQHGDDTVLVRLYTKFGVEIRQLGEGRSHSGARMGVVRSASDYDRLFVLAKEAHGFRLHEVSNELSRPVERTVPFPAAETPYMTVLDLGENGTLDLVIGAHSGDVPFVAQYTLSGELIEYFYGAHLGVTSGVQVGQVGQLLVTLPADRGDRLQWFEDGGVSRSAGVPAMPATVGALPLLLVQ